MQKFGTYKSNTMAMGFFNNPSNIPFSYGVKIAAGLIGFFLLMSVFNLAKIVELRLFNLVILVAGVYFALKKFKETHGDSINYFRALIVGVSTSAIASGIFALVMFFYMQLNSSFMQWIINNEPMGRYLNPYIIAFIVALE